MYYSNFNNKLTKYYFNYENVGLIMKLEKNILIKKYHKLSIDKKNPNCRIHSLAVMLNLNEIEISVDELMLLAMTHWIRACYVNNYHKLNLMLPFAFPDDIEEVVFTNLGIKYRNIGNEIKDFVVIKKFVDKEIPLLISFDCNKLTDRQSIKNINLGVLSTGVVLSYEGDELIFNAFGGRESDFRVSYEQMNNSRYSELMPVMAQGKIFVIDSVENKKDIDAMIWKQLRETVSLFLNVNQNPTVFDEERNIYQYYGCWSYDVLISYIEDLTKQMDSLSEQAANKIFSLVCSVLRKGITSGSGSMSRLEYGNALKKFANKNCCKPLEYAAEFIIESGKHWRNIARRLYTIKVSYPKSVQFLEEICFELKCVKDIEIKAMKMMNDTL